MPSTSPKRLARNAAPIPRALAFAPCKPICASEVRQSTTAEMAVTHQVIRPARASPANAHSNIAAAPTHSNRLASVRNRATPNARSTVSEPRWPASTCAATPAASAPGLPTWNTNAPLTGCESADTTRQATV